MSTTSLYRSDQSFLQYWPKKEAEKGLEFPQSPQSPGLCIIFFPKSWKICLLSSTKDKLHVDFKLHFPISEFI